MLSCFRPLQILVVVKGPASKRSIEKLQFYSLMKEGLRSTTSTCWWMQVSCKPSEIRYQIHFSAKSRMHRPIKVYVLVTHMCVITLHTVKSNEQGGYALENYEGAEPAFFCTGPAHWSQVARGFAAPAAGADCTPFLERDGGGIGTVFHESSTTFFTCVLASLPRMLARLTVRVRPPNE
jgi:hypothetical protein